MPVGSLPLLTIKFSRPKGVWYLQNSSKILCASLDGESGSWLKATLKFLGFSLVLHPCPSLMNNCLYLPIRTQGRPWSLNERSFLSSKKCRRRLPSWSSGWDHMVTSRGPGFDPLSGNRSHMLHPSAAKYINILKKEGGGHKDLVSRSPTGPCTEVRPDLHTESHSRFQWKKESPGLLLQI